MLTFILGYLCSCAIPGQVVLGSNLCIKKMNNITAIEGQDVTLRCLVPEISSFPSRFWTKYDDVIFANSLPPLKTSRFMLDSEYNIRIRSVSVKDEGSYICSAYADQMSQKGRLHLSVNVPPRVVNITKDLIVDEGRTVELFCIATGKPNPEITWRHILPSADEIRGRDQLLPLGEVKRGSAGLYECTADNGVSSPVTKSIHLTVNYKPQIDLDRIVVPLRVPVGASAKLKCVARGVPRPTIDWYNADGERARVNGRFNLVNLNQSDSLHSELFISTVRESDFGAWNCTARNTMGSAMQTRRILKKKVPPTRLPPYVVFDKSRSRRQQEGNEKARTQGGRQDGDGNSGNVVLPRCYLALFEMLLLACLCSI